MLMTTIEIADLRAPASPQPLPRPPALSTASIIAVLALTVGWGAISSALWLLYQGRGRLTGFGIAISNAQLIELLVWELALGISIAAYLRQRGWRFEHVTVPLSLRDLSRGIGLWLSMICVWAVIVMLAQAVPTLAASVEPSHLVGQVSWSLVAGVSLINPVFEEFLWLGFVSAGFYGAGAWRIGLLSVALRVIVHTYQGALALIFVGTIGIVFTVYYFRTGRLGPVIVAHAIQDAIGLSWLAAHSGTTWS